MKIISLLMIDKKEINENCPFKGLIQKWDDDDGDIIAVVCEGCAGRDECSEEEYN